MIISRGERFHFIVNTASSKWEKSQEGLGGEAGAEHRIKKKTSLR